MTSATQAPKLGPERPTQAHWLRPPPSGWVRWPLECVLPVILAGRPSLPGPSESGPCSPTTGSLGLPAPPPAPGLLPNSQPGSVGGGGALRQWGGGAHTLHPKGPCPTPPLPRPHAIHPPPRPQGSSRISQPLRPPAFLFLSARSGALAWRQGPGARLLLLPLSWRSLGMGVGPLQSTHPTHSPEPPLGKGARPQASPGPVCCLGLSPVLPLGPHGPRASSNAPSLCCIVTMCLQVFGL